MKKHLADLCELVGTVVGLVVAVVVQGCDGQQEDGVADGDHVERGPAKVLGVQVEVDVAPASEDEKEPGHC